MSKILDVCCGSRMFWFDKKNPNVTFIDNREENHVLCDGRKLSIKPDMLMNFTNLNFKSNTFNLVVFDPPHLLNPGKRSWMYHKYGGLDDSWKPMLTDGFKECFRVLKKDGVLIFKWSDVDINVSEILKLTTHKPLFGHRTMNNNRTIWLCFMKGK